MLLVMTPLFTTTYALTATIDGAGKPYQGVVRVGFFGDGEIEIFHHDGGPYCSGKTEATVRKRGRTGSSGIATLACADGRTIEAAWRQTSFRRGEGSGVDHKGNRVTFRFEEITDSGKKNGPTSFQATQRGPASRHLQKVD